MCFCKFNARNGVTVKKPSTSDGGSRHVLLGTVAVPDIGPAHIHRRALEDPSVICNPCLETSPQVQNRDKLLPTKTSEPISWIRHFSQLVTRLCFDGACLTGVDAAGGGPERLRVLVGGEHGRGVGGTVGHRPLVPCRVRRDVRLLIRDVKRTVPVVLVVFP